MNNNKDKVRKVLPFVVVILLIAPLLLQYIFRWNMHGIGLYGISLVLYMCTQFIFAYKNNKNNKEGEIKEDKVSEVKDGEINVEIKSDEQGEVNVMVVGYKENPDYFRECLGSLKIAYLNSSCINKVFVIIDGYLDDDQYMVKIFFEVFAGDKAIHFTKIGSLDYYIDYINNNDIICVSQMHGGKREAMMTGFEIACLEKNQVKAIFCTDSDTVILPNTVDILYKKLNENENVGAVGGNLGIYNKYESIVSFLSSIRYWYAFNVERAYQSLNGGVLCVSGPLGIYRFSSIKAVMKEWSEQKFLGNKCTYGDDRHLTNKILGLGQNVVYTPIAYAETETPIGVYRFYKQQTRWSKSAFREFWWSIGMLDKHSVFMTVDLVYTLVYPYIVIGYLIYVLWFGTIFKLGLYLTIVFILGVIKSIYGVIFGNVENLFYGCYTIIYVCIGFPAKIWALLNINDNSWGTSSRKIMNNEFSVDIIVPIVWNVILLTGFVINIMKINDYINLLYLFIPCSVWVIYFTVLLMYTSRKKLKNC